MTDIEDLCKKSSIISASRRTDIPAFYMPLVINAMKNKYINVTNYGRTTRVSMDPKDVKCIVWWSKNYGEWLKYFEQNYDLFMNYAHCFNFTITGFDELEKGVMVPLDQRLAQLIELVHLFGAQSIKYRFDPVVMYVDMKTGKTINNLDHLEHIVKKISDYGIKSLVFAFCIPYKNVVSRMKKRGKILLQLSIEQKYELLDKMIKITDKYNVKLESCCGTDILGYKNKIFPSKCIDGNQIEKILHKHLSENKKDVNQRKECGCAVSKDIGSYEMVCRHSCDYCYATPS